MNRRLLFALFALYGPYACAQTVTQIAAEYHDGQVFLTWTNIPGVDTGFYYVYRNTVPISESNIQSSEYVGRTYFNFAYDHRLSYAIADNTYRFLITNDTPYTVLDTTQNLMVMNCSGNGLLYYYAVRSAYGSSGSDWTVVPGENATLQPVTCQMEPIRAYLQESNLKFDGAKAGEKMDVYLHYGGNTATETYPAMANEACLAFHFGIVKEGPVGGNNACFLKFHGGNGSFFTNSITVHMEDAWKISFDDWIPAYQYDSAGNNTRWLGYHEFLDVYAYHKDTPPPDSGIIKAFTYHRIRWELDWIKKTWPGTLDSNRMYLVGNSQGCSAVMLHSVTDPARYAASNATDVKFNGASEDDSNPECNYNDGNQGRLESRILWGHEDSTNLLTDIPVKPGSGEFYRIYHVTNMNFMFHHNRNMALPYLRTISGKKDEITCWQEKIEAFDTIEAARMGGNCYWDLRYHGGSPDDNAWPALSIPYLLRFRTNRTYPAFSHSSMAQDAGSDSVTLFPYYNGDDIGSLHGSIDWRDSSIVDEPDLWQLEFFLYQDTLNNSSLLPAILPDFALTDVTIRRAQHFTGFVPGTALCWMNFYRGRMIQSGVVVAEMDDTVPRPVTIPQVKIHPDGTILKVMPCDSIPPTGSIPLGRNLHGEISISESRNIGYPEYALFHTLLPALGSSQENAVRHEPWSVTKYITLDGTSFREVT